MELSETQQAEFLETLWDFYAHHKRGLPWRTPMSDCGLDPYKIMVSELMLQQTQVVRVVPKYREFLEQFSTVQALARANLGDLLRIWQGLGYNRRAKFLWQAAQAIDKLGHFPDTLDELITLPGVGVNTAGAILAYAYNQPALFIETNIRTVYIHHFFADEIGVADEAIIELLNQTLDREQPREFYWALMDYGSYLKAAFGNANKVSKHYAKQSKLNGSKRQIRGAVIRVLGGGDKQLSELRQTIADERLANVLRDLVAEGLVRERNGVYAL